MVGDPFRCWIEQWHLVADGAPLISDAGNRLLPVLHGGAPAMLKISHHEEEIRGAAAMHYFAGYGLARVLAHDGAAILLERATGDRSLARMAAEGGDDEATLILCEVAARLHAPRGCQPPPTLVPLEIWFQPLREAAVRHGGAFTRAAFLADTLFHDPPDPVVLHGDLHHDNVLDGGARGWFAIDPKGLLGERSFDFANLFRNPCSHVALTPGRLARRVGIVAKETALEPSRVLQWVLVYAGLGAAWSLEIGESPEANFAIVELAGAELG